MSPSHRPLLACDALQQQISSVLDCRLGVSGRSFSDSRYVSAYLVVWDDLHTRCPDKTSLTASLAPVMRVSSQHNPPVQKYLTMLETPVVHGFPTVPPHVPLGVKSSIIRNASGRAPIEHMANNPVPSLISTFVTVDPPAPHRSGPATTCGTLRAPL